jgi:hypothetical protein
MRYLGFAVPGGFREFRMLEVMELRLMSFFQWLEQNNHCYRCCSTWGETVINVKCESAARGNQTVVAREKRPAIQQERDDSGRELGFS